MDGYQIFTDATSDLAPELTAGLPSVEMIPMNVDQTVHAGQEHRNMGRTFR